MNGKVYWESQLTTGLNFSQRCDGDNFQKLIQYQITLKEVECKEKEDELSDRLFRQWMKY